MKVYELIDWLSQQDPQLDCMVRDSNGDEQWLEKVEPVVSKMAEVHSYHGGTEFQEHDKRQESNWSLSAAIKLLGPERGAESHANFQKRKNAYLNQPWIDAVILGG